MSTASWASETYEFPPIPGMQTQLLPPPDLNGSTGGVLAGMGPGQVSMLPGQILPPQGDIRGVGATFDQVAPLSMSFMAIALDLRVCQREHTHYCATQRQRQSLALHNDEGLVVAANAKRFVS